VTVPRRTVNGHARARGVPPVIAIDGPSASGKGTVAQLVARRLGFHFLDSGVLYRLVALAALDAGVDVDDDLSVSDMALKLKVTFKRDLIELDGWDVSLAIRAERVGEAASRVAALPGVRRALLQRQRAYRKRPGLVADGRDMGSIVFPDAVLKVFLTASPEERAQRRYKQLMEKGLSANMAVLLKDIRERDARDSARAVAPLKKAPDAVQIDTTSMTVDAVVAEVLARFSAAQRAP
jgi:cytidylate kinase